MIQMIQKIDVNRDGCVDIDEFGELYKLIMDDRNEDKDMNEAFNVFNQNGDRFVTKEELITVLASLGLKHWKALEECKE
ncbi:hypothetical protein K1719_024575 [Acacia pycnantha]|nr:hypothetical protein K1719_024575 [Acacia pycnantha]